VFEFVARKYCAMLKLDKMKNIDSGEARIWCEGDTNRGVETETLKDVDWVKTGRSMSLPRPPRGSKVVMS